MSQNNNSERFPFRKSPRLPGYDYKSPNYYFVTICTKGKVCLFGTPAKLNDYGQIANTGLVEIGNHFPGVHIDKHVVMPNHIHAIVVLTGSTADLSVIIGQYKSFVSKTIHTTDPNITVWQTSFHDHIIRNRKSYENIWMYIDTNPMKWQDDCFFTEDTAQY